MSSEKTPFVEKLPCQLTPSEERIRAKEMARLQLERDKLTLERSLASQRIAKEIKDADRRIGELAEQVRTGVEYREVRVSERKNFEQNVVEVIRLDTKEVCGQRAMRAEERQKEMFPKVTDGRDAAQLELGAANGGVVEDGEPLGPDDEEGDDDDPDEEASHGAELEH